MGNWKIGSRLSAAFGLIVLLLLLLAGASLLKMRQMHDAADEVASVWLPAVATVKTLRFEHSHLRLALANHIMNTQPEAMSRLETLIEQRRATVEKTRQAFEALITEPSEKEIYRIYLGKWQQLQELHKKVLALSSQNLNEEARVLFEGEGKQVFDSLQEDVEKLAKINEQGSSKAAQASTAAYSAVQVETIILVLIAVGATVVLSVLIVRSITTPLHQAVEVAHHITQGDLSQPIHAQYRDEIGTLLVAMNEMQSSLIRVVGTVR